MCYALGPFEAMNISKDLIEIEVIFPCYAFNLTQSLNVTLQNVLLGLRTTDFRNWQNVI